MLLSLLLIFKATDKLLKYNQLLSNSKGLFYQIGYFCCFMLFLLFYYYFNYYCCHFRKWK